MKHDSKKTMNLISAKAAKKDEFYTQYDDIAKEIEHYVEYDENIFRDKVMLCPCDDPDWSNFSKYFSDNFERFGLKKLITTSYSKSSRSKESTGKVFIKTRRGVSFSDLRGDGDFRSPEIKSFLDKSDFIVTNPPFSLFRPFLQWIGKKKFSIIGNLNAVTCKDVFPLIKDNLMWFGASIHGGDRKFYVPDDYPLNAYACGVDENGKRFIRVKGVRWFTNINYADRYSPLSLHPMAENLESKKKFVRRLQKNFGMSTCPKYDGYDAIEIPYSDVIPSDFDGAMGVPITFLDKYCPSQFEIIGLDRYVIPKQYLVGGRAAVNGRAGYARIIIKRK